MTTAFTYSGTGLESAIQSGSGGIGTGSSITLEVDAIPADVEQGDTVKVALGSASDWSGGNGETAYGDIGGAGANGGTNITLTDRGQEGTSAASWSEGDPVRVGVQGRDDAGPESAIIGSDIVPASERLTHYADFAGVTTSAVNGYTIASGQQLTVQDGSWEIQNGLLRNTNTPAIVTFPQTNFASTFAATIHLDSAQIHNNGLLLEYEDNTTFFYNRHSDTGSSLDLVKKTDGTFTQVKSDKIGNHTSAEDLTMVVKWQRTDTNTIRANCFSDLGQKVVTAGDMDSSLHTPSTQGFVAIGGTIKVENFRVYAPRLT
jgi:hypothetical protein